MWIHRILIILLLLISSIIVKESGHDENNTNTDTSTTTTNPPAEALISSVTTSANLESSENTTEGNDKNSKCPGDHLIVMKPEMPFCESDSSCLPDNRELRATCQPETKWCCQELPLYNLSQFCNGTHFPLFEMYKCSDLLPGDVNSGFCKSSPGHFCVYGRCCPKVEQSEGNLTWPKTVFKSNYSCDFMEYNTTEVTMGTYCSLNESWQFVGKMNEDWKVVVEDKTSCDTSGECSAGLSCVTFDKSGGKCTFLLPPVPKTTTTTTTKKPTTTTIPEEATTFDPYNSWGAYLARGWERNKLLFYFSCLFCYCGILGTCFFWLKKKFFIWIMRPDPYEDTPSMRSMQRAFDIVEERERNRRRRKKFRFFSFGR